MQTMESTAPPQNANGRTVSPASAPTSPAVNAADTRPLHPRYYTDPAVLAAEQRRIFARTWQLVGHVSDLPQPGSQIVGRAGDQEVLVARDEDGTLHAHRNVCRHRGARLVTGPEQAQAIRCPYHGWTYHLNGSLVGAPESRRYAAPLDKPALGLFPVRVEVWHGLVFVNLDARATPLSEQLTGLSEKIGRYLSDDLVPVGKSRMHQVDDAVRTNANWKVTYDNYLEGYHVPVAHPGLMRLYDYANYIVGSLEPGYAYFEVPIRDTPSSNRLERLYQATVKPMPGLLPEDLNTWRYIAIYPNTLIDLAADFIGVWSMVPDSPGVTALPGAFYRHPEAGLRTRAAQYLNARINALVAEEDDDIVSRVQRGISTTPGYRVGPLADREVGIGWFANRVRTDLGIDAPAEDDEPLTSQDRPAEAEPEAETAPGIDAPVGGGAA
jgi:choline monooxygenase